MNPRIKSEDLQPILDQVEEYPVTSDELASKAQAVGAGDQVLNFFESIPDTLFESEGEVLSMAEQIDDPSLTVTDGEEDVLGYEE